ncbi:MAG: dihydropteroate synthase [Candidatus Binatia bacterium]
MTACRILGIVNITEDSFSDGGRFLDPDRAIAHAMSLVADGADAIDLGAAASNPKAVRVAPEIEQRRLAPVIAHLKRHGIPVSVDSFEPATQCWALGLGVEFVNDTRGFPDSSVYPRLAVSRSRLVVMHAVQTSGKADRTLGDAATIYDRVVAFFSTRLAALEAAGIARERCILDPGMGLFLGGTGPSVVVLRRLADLRRRFALPVLVSVSRKSLLRDLTGRAVNARGPGTLAAELFAARQGVEWIRTHDVRALRDALAVARALGEG